MAYPDFFFDDFNRPDEALQLSTGWTHVDGHLWGVQIKSNTLESNDASAPYNSSLWCEDQGSVDHYVESDVLRSHWTAGFICNRHTDSDNFIGTRHTSDGGGSPPEMWEIYKRDTGSFTKLGFYRTLFTSGDTARLISQGNEHQLNVNGVPFASGIDAFNNTQTRQGVCGREYNSGPWLDNFKAGALDAGGGPQILTPSAIASAEVVGAATVAPGAVALLPGSIASGEAIGTHSLSSVTTIIAQAIASLEAMGSPAVLPGTVAVQPAAIPSAEAVGAHSFSSVTTIIAQAIASLEAMGSPAVAPGAVAVQPSAIPGAEAFGAVTLHNGTISLQPLGIASAEALGSPQIVASGLLLPTGIASAEAVGALSVVPGAVSIDVAGIGSGEAFGALTVQPGSVIIVPNGVVSAELFGDAFVIPGATVIAPSGIESGEQFGSILIIGGNVFIGWLLGAIKAYPALGGSLQATPALDGDITARPGDE